MKSIELVTSFFFNSLSQLIFIVKNQTKLYSNFSKVTCRNPKLFSLRFGLVTRFSFFKKTLFGWIFFYKLNHLILHERKKKLQITIPCMFLHSPYETHHQNHQKTSICREKCIFGLHCPFATLRNESNPPLSLPICLLHEKTFRQINPISPDFLGFYVLVVQWHNPMIFTYKLHCFTSWGFMF